VLQRVLMWRIMGFPPRWTHYLEVVEMLVCPSDPVSPDGRST